MKKKDQIKRPPLGLYPRFLWDEKRLYTVCSAITRYYQAAQELPIEWIEEYNELIRRKNGTGTGSK